MAGLQLPSRRPSSLLSIVSPDGVAEIERARDLAAAKLAQEPENDAAMTNLASFIRTEWDIMRSHRTTSGLGERLLEAQRTYNRKYSADKLMDIRKFGGSEVYAGLTSIKCRGVTAMLREIYLGTDRSWGLDPTPDPSLPTSLADEIANLINLEIQGMKMDAEAAGQPFQPDPRMISDRMKVLTEAARRAMKKTAAREANTAEDKLDDLLVEGNFYGAIADFLADLPIFPFAVVKGPIVRMVETIKWTNGEAETVRTPKMFWSRVSPFDLYFTPGVSSAADAAYIERMRLTRADLNDKIDLPGYDSEAIRAVLREYGRGGLRDWIDPTDQQRANGEGRESPWLNRSNMIDCLEYHGNVQGSMLIEQGFTKQQIADPDRDYFVQAWLIGRYVIKTQINPSPRKRPIYYVTSYEKVPGTLVGNALPDILSDIQEMSSANLRALANNMAMASGPQVVVNHDRLAEGEDGNEIYPWKRWATVTDPLAQNNNQPPIEFFQPNSIAQELLGVFEKLAQIGDEYSAIPRYMTGSERLGGAGRTASGLAMLMGNASKVLQTVASQIDRDVMEPCIHALYDMLMLTDTQGFLRGDEQIRVRGVEVAIQRETNRQRQLEFLQITANPMDSQIMGPKGRAVLLRETSSTLGLPGENIVPSEDDMEQQEKAAADAAKQAALMQMAAGVPPGMEQPPGGAPKGQGSAPAPASTNLGVQEGQTVQGMTG